MYPQLLAKRESDSLIYCGKATNPRVLFHFHSPIELYLVEDGEIDVWINDSHRTLKAGEMSVAFSYNAHRYYTKNNATSIYLIIPYDKCVEFNALIRDKCTDDPFITDRDTFDKIKACCDVIMNNCNTLLTTGCVYAILGILLIVCALSHAPRASNRKK